jgi:hypothetical protein
VPQHKISKEKRITGVARPGHPKKTPIHVLPQVPNDRRLVTDRREPTTEVHAQSTPSSSPQSWYRSIQQSSATYGMSQSSPLTRPFRLPLPSEEELHPPGSLVIAPVLDDERPYSEPQAPNTTFPAHQGSTIDPELSKNNYYRHRDDTPPPPTIPLDACWTKISRKLVDPEALNLGNEDYEAREDFVIVMRILTRDEVQRYAEVTQRMRGL